MTIEKALNEYDTFIRYPIADSIVEKVVSVSRQFMSEQVTARKPFGLATNVLPIESGDITLRYNKGVGPFNREAITTNKDLIDKWNVMMSYLSAEHAGQPDKNGKFRILSTTDILPPGYVCTETYLLAGSFDTEQEAQNHLCYLKTKLVRFLIAQLAISQHITRKSFAFVPAPDTSKLWVDEDLYEKYNLTPEEIQFIESMIKPMP